MSKEIGVAILGGTGYGAGELLRLLSSHPATQIVSVISSSSAGEKISDAHPHLRGITEDKFVSEVDLDRLLSLKHSVIFTSLPHGKSSTAIAELIQNTRFHSVRIIDLGGDLRLKDAGLHQRFYPESSAVPGIREQFVYGLPELGRESIRKAQFITNPGCYATACILAARPLVTNSFRGQVIFDAKSGSSGAGRTPQSSFHHPELHSNAFAYKVFEHRHEPEIRQALGDPHGNEIQTVFVPQVIPVARGILVSAYLTLEKESSTQDLMTRFREFYADSRFVRVVDEPPSIANVVGSNFCDVSVRARGKQVVCFAALDNLVKGMAGQAIQNMNLMVGLPEETALLQPALRLT